MPPARGSKTQAGEVTALIDELKTILSATDPAGPATREYLKDVTEKLSLALERPGETVQRVAYYVSFSFRRIFPPQQFQPHIPRDSSPI